MMRAAVVLAALLIAGPLSSPLALAAPVTAATSGARTASGLSASTLSALKFRSIGPAVNSGRISDLAVDPRDPSVWYVAAAYGGVWKTTNAGTTFEPIFDAQGTSSIGCVTLAPSRPLTVWVGTGENNSQRSVGWGDGVYRSDDGGR
ncbi:MAG: WD40/YVTN/BNR-like repeat-containing protein, partial [bacterium]